MRKTTHLELIRKHTEELHKPERNVGLQKTDEATNELIDDFRAYLFAVGVRATRERAWQILQKAHRLPYEHLIEKNKEGIEYQGQGRHISSKHGDQLLVVRDLGRFEVKAVSNRRKNRSYNATIKFRPSLDLMEEIRENIPVLCNEELDKEKG